MIQGNNPEIECTDFAPYRYDMDDQTSLEERYKTKLEIKISHEPLRKGIKFLNDHISRPYRETDKEALKFQKMHKNIATGAILLGYAAILFAIMQFCLLSLSFEMTIPFLHMEIVELFRIGEMIAIIFAAMAVVAGLFRAPQNRWLLHRHIAERYRLLKFRSLLNTRFWNEDEYGKWEEQVSRDIRELQTRYNYKKSVFSYQIILTDLRNKIHTIFQQENEEPNAVERWINGDKVPVSPASIECTYSHDVKVEFLEYYRKKRLNYQKNYYYCAHKRFKKTHVKTKTLPHVLFFASVGAVLAHFLLDFIAIGPFGHVASIALIGIAVSLPFAGSVVKTHRETFQVAKSSSLYYAKYSALENLDKQVSRYESSIDENWEEILDTLWQCENFLEAEHREWLILIYDSDWFL